MNEQLLVPKVGQQNSFSEAVFNILEQSVTEETIEVVTASKVMIVEAEHVLPVLGNDVLRILETEELLLRQ